MSQQIEALFVPYSLGLLSETERKRVEQYVAHNPEAEAVLAMLLDETYTLAVEEITPLAPTRATKENLMQRVRAEAVATQPVAERVTPAPRVVASPKPRRNWFEWLNWRPTVPSVAFAALGLIVVLFLGSWVNNLNQRLDTQSDQIAALMAENGRLTEDVGALNSDVSTLQSARDALQASVAALEEENSELVNVNDSLEASNSDLQASNSELNVTNDELAFISNQLQVENSELLTVLGEQEDVVALLNSPHIHSVSLAGTEDQPEALGQLVTVPDSNVALLIVSDLADLEVGLEYQILLIRETGHDTAETFTVNATGQNLVVIRADSEIISYTQVGISIEPAGGSEQRTGDVVMIGDLPSSN